MNSPLIELGLSNEPSTLLKTKVECYKSLDDFASWSKDSSATKIPCRRLMGRHSWTKGSLVGWGSYLPSELSQSIL